MSSSNKQYDVGATTVSDSHWQTLRTLGHYLWPKDRNDLRFRVIFALLFLVAAKGLNVVVPFFLKGAIDKMSVDSVELKLAIGMIVAYGAARVTVQLFGEIRDLIFVKVSQNALRSIALSTFKHMHSLSLDFHLARKTGGLSRVIERGSRAIQFVLSFMTFNIVPTLLEIVMVTGILVYQFDIYYALVVLTTIILYIGSTLWVTEWRLKFRRKMNSEESKANTKAIDSLLNYETVKYFGNEKHEFVRFDENLASYEKAAVKSQFSLSLLNTIQGVIIGCGLITVMVMAARGVADGSKTIGDFVLVNTFLIQLYLPLNFLGFVYREIKQSLIDMDKMFELVKVNLTIVDGPQAIKLEKNEATVEFKDVEFSYVESRKILKKVSFKVDHGKTLAIVGPSGSGKSTISRLLFRFYDVQNGQILVGGHDIRELKQESLRGAIGVVPQDTVLFNDTIGYNIHYGKVGSTDEEVRQAAKHAQIGKFIESLPDGFETEVGERGLKLSGGEKQRVAIARTVLKSPQLFIFDEATSALDSQTEKEIQKSLDQVSRNRTTLVIAHRLSTIVNADQIIVLKDGEIVERGSHQELLELGGEYDKMWSRQREEQEYAEKLEACRST